MWNSATTRLRKKRAKKDSVIRIRFAYKGRKKCGGWGMLSMVQLELEGVKNRIGDIWRVIRDGI